MADEELIAKDHSIQLQQTAPVVTTMETYFSLTKQGTWGDWKDKLCR
jgi:hypothetical protein